MHQWGRPSNDAVRPYQKCIGRPLAIPTLTTSTRPPTDRPAPAVRPVSEVEEHRAPGRSIPANLGVLVVDVQGPVGHEGADERLPVRQRQSHVGAGHERTQTTKRLLVGSQFEEERPKRVGVRPVASRRNAT